jgi:hypothetical protein
VRLDVRVFVWDGRIFCVTLEPQQVILAVDHAVEQYGRRLNSGSSAGVGVKDQSAAFSTNIYIYIYLKKKAVRTLSIS